MLSGLDAHIVDVRMPDLTGMVDAWVTLCSSEAAAAHAANYPSRASEHGPSFREILRTGTGVTAQQLADAQKKRTSITGQFADVLESVDAMACPAGGHPA